MVKSAKKVLIRTQYSNKKEELVLRTMDMSEFFQLASLVLHKKCLSAKLLRKNESILIMNKRKGELLPIDLFKES